MLKNVRHPGLIAKLHISKKACIRLHNACATVGQQAGEQQTPVALTEPNSTRTLTYAGSTNSKPQRNNTACSSTQTSPSFAHCFSIHLTGAKRGEKEQEKPRRAAEDERRARAQRSPWQQTISNPFGIIYATVPYKRPRPHELTSPAPFLTSFEARSEQPLWEKQLKSFSLEGAVAQW